MYCRCPGCKALFEAGSGDFGNEFQCARCSWKALLDVEHLAKFSLPEEICVQMAVGGRELAIAGKSVVADYGYKIGPVLTDSTGKAFFNKSQFEKAQYDEIMSGLMDHKGNYSLSRYIRFSVDKKSVMLDLEEIKDSVKLIFDV